MKKYIFLFLAALMLNVSCTNKSGSNDIVGTWNEYRADASDDAYLSSWKFNDDGSGIFKVNGITNTQKQSFMWKKINDNTIQINSNGSTRNLELNNGMLIEKSAFGTIVFKK